MRGIPGSIWVAGVAIEGLWICTYIFGPLREHTGAFLALMLASFALCAWSFFRIPLAGRTAAVVLAFGFLFRMTLLAASPWQSEDVYRYIWDARVAHSGIAPYRYPPDAPELEHLRDAKIYPMINSKPYVTAYPPLSQILFRICRTVFGESVTAMKAVFSLLEFASVVLIWKLLELLGTSLQPLFLVAWNPLFIFEFSHSGHSDSAMMFLILLSVYLIRRSRRGWGMISYAGAVLSKLHPALLFPLFFRRSGWKASLAGAAGGALVLSAYLFNFSSAFGYVNSLKLYYRLFEFNAGIHYLLRFAGRSLFAESWDKLTGPYLLIVLLAIAGAIAWRFPARDERDLLHAAFWIMTADLCLSTTVHPWYLSWAALMLPFFPYAFMFYWTGAAFLSYTAYSSHPVNEPTWALLIEYLPMYALMGYEILTGSPLLGRKLGESKKILSGHSAQGGNRRGSAGALVSVEEAQNGADRHAGGSAPRSQ